MKRTLPSETFQNVKKPQHKPSFDVLLLEAVDDTLSFLGKPAKAKINFYLRKTAGIKKKDIPHELEKFISAIEEIFGAGAYLLEIHIMRKLYEKVGEDFEYYPKGDNLIFIEYVDAARLSNLLTKKNDDLNSYVATAPHCLAVAKST
jgi:hypothetical protein